MDRRWKIIALGSFVLANVGCAGYYHVPWLNPGRAEEQQIRAMREHDPYPDPNAGPDFQGSRPMAFDTPPAEPAWGQQRSPRKQRFPSYVPAPAFVPAQTLPPGVNPAQPAIQTNQFPPAGSPGYTLPYGSPAGR